MKALILVIMLALLVASTKSQKGFFPIDDFITSCETDGDSNEEIMLQEDQNHLLSDLSDILKKANAQSMDRQISRMRPNSPFGYYDRKNTALSVLANMQRKAIKKAVMQKENRANIQLLLADLLGKKK